MVNIQATALICRLTNVVVGRYSSGTRGYQDIPGVNQGDTKHGRSHVRDTATLVKIDRYNAGLLATILGTLAKVPKGNGTMLDSTLCAWTDSGCHHQIFHDTMPLILIGSMNGHFKTGRYVHFPRRERTLNDAFVSLLNALGIPDQTFGDPSACKGPLPGLT